MENKQLNYMSALLSVELCDVVVMIIHHLGNSIF